MPEQRRNCFGRRAAKRRLKFWHNVGRVLILGQLGVVGNAGPICMILAYDQRRCRPFVDRWYCIGGLGIVLAAMKL